MNERDFAEKVLNEMYAKKESYIPIADDLSLQPNVIRKNCVSAEGKGFGEDSVYKYKLNSKGIQFVLDGCWSGIEKTRAEQVEKLNLNRKRERRNDRLFAVIMSAISGLLVFILTIFFNNTINY